MFPFEGVFHPQKQKKSHLERDLVNREGGARGSCHFGQKLLNTQPSVGRCAHKSPIMKCANAGRVLRKNSLKLNAASYNITWYTDTDGFLEHSPVLQGILIFPCIPVLQGSLYYKGCTLQKITPVYF